MSRRMRFIMQVARMDDEAGWLEHELDLAVIAGADLADQPERLRKLADRINTLADNITAPAKLKAVA